MLQLRVFPRGLTPEVSATGFQFLNPGGATREPSAKAAPLLADPKKSPNACQQRAGVVLSKTLMPGICVQASFPGSLPTEEQFGYLQDDSTNLLAYWLCKTHEDGGKLSPRKLEYYFTIRALFKKTCTKSKNLMYDSKSSNYTYNYF